MFSLLMGLIYLLRIIRNAQAFAKSKGYLLQRLIKIDAKVIGEYGLVMQVKASGFGVTIEVEKLGDLLKRRAQLLEDKNREKHRLEKATTPKAKRLIKSHIRWIEKAKLLLIFKTDAYVK